MNLPTELDFLGHCVTIHYLDKEACEAACGHPLGGYNFHKLEIYVNKLMPQSRQEETLLHEISEMLLYYADGFERDNEFDHLAFQKWISMLYAIMKQNGIIN